MPSKVSETVERGSRLCGQEEVAAGPVSGQTWSRFGSDPTSRTFFFFALAGCCLEFAANVDKKATGSQHLFVCVWSMSADDPVDIRTGG